MRSTAKVALINVMHGSLTVVVVLLSFEAMSGVLLLSAKVVAALERPVAHGRLLRESHWLKRDPDLSVVHQS